MHLVSRLVREIVAKQNRLLQVYPEAPSYQNYLTTKNTITSFHKVSSKLRPGHLFRSGFFLFAIFLSLFSPLQAQERATITLDISAEQSLDIDWDHSKNYRLQLPDNLSGNWLLSLEQRGVDVTPVLISSADKEIISTDAPILAVGTDRLVFNATTLNGSTVELPLKTQVISPGGLRVKLQAVADTGLYAFLRQVMVATAVLQNKNTILPQDVDCQTSVEGFAKDPGMASQCFKAAAEQYKPEYKKIISAEELDYFLADSVRRQGFFNDAQRLYLPLIRQQTDVRIQALALHGLAWSVWQSGERSIAKTFAAQAIPAYNKWQHQDATNRGVIYQTLSVRNIACLILHDQELLDQAEACYLALEPDVHNASDYTTEATLIGNLGGLYYRRGDILRARIQFKQAFDLYTRVGSDGERARALANIGLTEIRAGNFDAALHYYQRATAMAVNTTDTVSTDRYKRRIANIYQRLGDVQRARQIYHELEVSALEKGDKTSTAAVALIADFENKFELARKYYLLSLESERAQGNNSWIVRSLLNLADLESRMGELDTAATYLNEANQLLTNVETNSIQNRASFVKGQYALKKGSFPEAIEYLKQARRAYKQAGNEYQLAFMDMALADAYIGSLDFNSAERHAKNAIEILTVIRPENISMDLRASFSLRQRKAYEKLIDLYLQLWQQEPAAGWSRKALIWAERARAQTLREAVRESASTRTLNHELQQRRKDINDQLNALATIRLKGREQQNSKLADLDSQYEQALVKLESFDQQYFPLQQASLIPVDIDIAKLLLEMPANTAILSFYISEDYGVLWVLAAGELKTYTLPSNNNLTVKVNQVLSALRRPSGYHDVKSELNALGADLDPKLPAGIEQLRIIADGILNYLPFAVLPLSDQSGEPWLSRYRLSYSPFIDAANIGRESTNWNGIRIFADPNYDQQSIHQTEQNKMDMTYPSDLGLYRLRGSMVEANIIEKLASNNMSAESNISILSGAKATRHTVLEGTTEDTDILHFATHGIFNPEGSSLSGLALSVVDQQGQQQPWLLTAQEIYHAPINSRLVVMSACDAGTGKLLAGEGLLGMVRAFMYTGVSDVVSSQWKVSDRAAVELMRGFYTALLEKNQPVSEALRQAQLNFVQSDNYNDPFYWAGFSDFQQ